MRSSLLISCALLIWMHAGSEARGQSDELGETPADQQAAIVALKGYQSNLQKNRDGTVRFVRFSKTLVTDAHLSHITVFKQLDYLAVITPGVTEEGLKHIVGLTNLDSLILSDSQAGDATIALLGEMARLDTLELDGTKITSASLQMISTRQALTHLSLARTAVDDSALSQLAMLPVLEHLDLSGTQISDAAVSSLAQLATLKSLRLDDTALTGKGLAALGSLEQLDLLSLNGTNIQLENLSELKQLVSVKEILLRRTSLTRQHISELITQMPGTRLRMTPTEGQRLSTYERYLAGQPLATANAAGDGLGATDPNIPVQPSVAVRFAKPGDEAPLFQRHIVPLLGKMGCNGRTCHGSFQGKGGFTLSMFGYDFTADHASMTEDGSGRIQLDDPTESLVLLKPTMQIDHGGGERFTVDSWQYNLLAQWIKHGAHGSDEPATLVRLDVAPAEVIFNRQGQKAKLEVIANWNDGSREDVTTLVRMEIIDDQVADVDSEATVHSKEPGDTHVVISYDKHVVTVPVMRPVSRLTGNRFPDVPTPTRVDELVVAKLAKLGIVPSQLSNDEDFLRRVSLDIAGTLPSPQQIKDFVADNSENKRAVIIDALLETTAYVDWWALRLTDLTGSSNALLGSTDMNSPSARQWEAWIRRRIEENVGWDKIAAGILLAESRRPGQTYDEFALEQSSFQTDEHRQGFTDLQNPMHYYWARDDLREPADRALSFGYIFLGVRLQCAQCHKHPFDQWSKQDFDEFSNIFSRMRWGTAPDSSDAHNRLKQRLGVPIKLDTAALRRQMYMRVSREGLPIPWREVYVDEPADQPQVARLLGGSAFDLNEFADPREPLFSWLVSRDNPYFTRAVVNRFWFHYFGYGIVNPVDDLSAGNPAANEALLAYLANAFADNGYDLKWLHREITNSRTYQLSWQTNDTNKNDARHFSHNRIRRLQAEVVVDSIEQATAGEDRNRDFANNTSKRKITLHPGTQSPQSVGYALAIFGKPTRSVNCDCERTVQPTLLQGLYVRNDREVLEQIERKDGWLAELAGQLGEELVSETGAGVIVKASDQVTEQGKPSHQQIVTTAYLRTLSRFPTEAEREFAIRYVQSSESTVEGTRELLWALLNTQEFITNH